jgi:hypothetical protein
VGERARGPLAERIALLAEAGVHEAVSVATPLDALRAARRLARRSGVYVLGLDSVTTPVLAWGVARRAPVVLDLGDDAYALARAAGSDPLRALPRWLVDAGARRTAPAVVYRGRLHPILRSLPSRAIWCPDTVPDSVLATTLPVGDPEVIATFGSIRAPDPSDGWTYGRELVDALEADRRLRGVIVGRGPGVEYFRELAKDHSLSARLTVHDVMPLEALLETISAARFVTSYQSDDRAGWVRTTGKLPLVLGSGRALLSSDVGEAALVLPIRWRLAAERGDFGAAIASRITELGNANESATARALAERYRRSGVAARLADFLKRFDDAFTPWPHL